MYPVHPGGASHRRVGVPAMVPVLLAGLVLAWPSAWSAPRVTLEDSRQVVTGAGYQLALSRDRADLTLALQRPDGTWDPVTRAPTALAFGILSAEAVWTANGLPVSWERTSVAAAEVFAGQVLLEPLQGARLNLHLVCADEAFSSGRRSRHDGPRRFVVVAAAVELPAGAGPHAGPDGSHTARAASRLCAPAGSMPVSALGTCRATRPRAGCGGPS